MEDNNSISKGNDVINAEDVIQDKVDFWFNWVDLGLPSGTRWCKYNLGCDFDLLKNNPNATTVNDWYGKYYSWGEIEPKNYFGERTYLYGFNPTKYNKKDNLTRLLPEDDAATKYFNNRNIHIPTKAQCEELLSNTYHKWTNDYHGVMGFIFTSKINDNELFIPVAGYYYGGSSRQNGGEQAVLMTSDLSNFAGRKDLCESLILKENESFITNSLYRNCGFSIRPVINVR